MIRDRVLHTFDRISIFAVLLVATLAVAGCTSAATTSAPSKPPRTLTLASPTSVPAATTPITGVTSCASGAIAVILGKKQLSLASCAGLYVSSTPPPTIYLSPGERIAVRGTGTITFDNSGIASSTATEVSAIRAGRSDVRFANVPGGCLLTSADGVTSHVHSEKCVAFVIVVR